MQVVTVVSCKSTPAQFTVTYAPDRVVLTPVNDLWSHAACSSADHLEDDRNCWMRAAAIRTAKELQADRRRPVGWDFV